MKYMRLALPIICGLLAGAAIVLPEKAVAETLQELLPGVVRIIAKTSSGVERYGSGFIIQKKSDELAILTAAHMVAGDQYPMVEFRGKRGKKVKAEVQEGSELDDPIRGLALLIVRKMSSVPQNLKVLSLSSDVVQVRSGEYMAVLGLPRAAGDWAVINGHMISRRGRDLKFDARIDDGASGGPVIRNGEVVGLVQTIETYAQGNPADSMWVFLQGFGIRPDSGGMAVSSVVERDTGSIPSLASSKIGKDEAPMVLVPAGEFTMGSPEGEGGTDEHPQHAVYLDDFYIDQYEVTVERYQRFMIQTSHANPDYWDQVKLSRDGQKPVVGINWDEAKAYCQWAEKRLPTEAEWEKAARGKDKRTYPWGSTKPNSSTANFGKTWSDNIYGDRLKNVGTYDKGKSPYGVYDMADNVWEWVVAWYARDYYQKSAQKNPQGPSIGERKVFRGGSWRDRPHTMNSSNRHWGRPTKRYAPVGFRCAQDAH